MVPVQRTVGGAVARTKSGQGGAVLESATGRVPPHDLEVEKAVLSALLLDNQ